MEDSICNVYNQVKNKIQDAIKPRKKKKVRRPKNTFINATTEISNFTSVIPTDIFNQIQKIAIQVCCQSKGFAPSQVPAEKGIAKKFYSHTSKKSLVQKVLQQMKRACTGISEDKFICKIVCSVLGCLPPQDSRILDIVEPILTKFLLRDVYQTKKKLSLQCFPTEDSEAAIVYILNTLKYNGLLIPGDNIGIITPISSSYLEIPTLKNYELIPFCIQSDQDLDIPDDQLEKLSTMKALILSNPNNPNAMSLSTKTLKKIKKVIKQQNPNLMIISDNSTAPLATEFNSLLTVLPQNTIAIYSFSKYFGLPSASLSTIVMNKSNIYDRKLLKEYPGNRYGDQKLKLIDRIYTDSRQTKPGNTSLSTPQQIFMAIAATITLLEPKYKTQIQQILFQRSQAILEILELEIPINQRSTYYYTTVNIPSIINPGNCDFNKYLEQNHNPIDFVKKLTKEYNTAVLPSIAFAGSLWEIRISTADLTLDQCRIAAHNIKTLTHKYYELYKNSAQ